MIIRNTICRPFSVEIKNIRYVIQHYPAFEVRAWHKYFQGNSVYTERIEIHNELLVVPYPCHRCILILSCVEYMILYRLYDYIGPDRSVGYKYSWCPFFGGSFIHLNLPCIVTVTVIHVVPKGLQACLPMSQYFRKNYYYIPQKDTFCKKRAYVGYSFNIITNEIVFSNSLFVSDADEMLLCIKVLYVYRSG